MQRTTALIVALALPFVVQAAPAAAQQRRVFISPMGQPFHGSDQAPDPERAWFAAADSNADGAITRAEFQADAARFFATLDRGHDGEIDPDDIENYENAIAPEVRSGDGGARIIAPSSDSEGGAKTPAYDASRLGAARFSYFDLPEPVTAADRNLNRGVDAREFADAADKRFDSLDKNRDGKLSWDELPHVRGRAEQPGKGRGPGGHRGGQHRRGGYGGGSFGGMGGQ